MNESLTNDDTDGSVDYSHYDAQELLRILDYIDPVRWPNNFQNLKAALETFGYVVAQDHGSPTASRPGQEATESPDASQNTEVAVPPDLGMTLKFRCILWPLLAAAAAFAVIYSLVNWLLVARSNLLGLNEDVVDYWLPLGLAWLLVLITVWPALGMLKADKKGNLPFFYHAAAVAMIAVPTMFAQGYVRTATGELTHLASFVDIGSTPATKYYSAQQICVDRTRAWTRLVAYTSGRYNETLNLRDYVVLPLCKADRVKSSDSVWLGYELHTSVSNHASADEKNEAYEALSQQVNRAVHEWDPETFNFFERIGRTSNRKDFAAALNRAGVDLEGPATILLIPHTESFEERTGNRLVMALVSFGIGAALWLVIALAASLDPTKAREWRSGTRNEGKWGALEDAFAFLVSHKDAWGLQVLLAVNILVFVAMVLSGLGVVSFDRDDLLAWGANYRPALHGLGYLRLVTSEFVHNGLMHLANNMYGLVFAGIFLLPIAGNAGLIACYVLGGLGGSVASAYVHPAIVSVGASGAIFGLFGVLLVHLLMGDKKLVQSRRALLPMAAIFVVLNLVLGAASSGIDNAAHVGGLATGVALGFILFWRSSDIRAGGRAEKGA